MAPGISLNTADVNSLYTNIPNLEGILAVAALLLSHRSPLVVPKNSSLIDLLELVLTLNNFQFNGENYLQIGGTVMGTKVAPSFANIFMSDFEDKHVQSTIWTNLYCKTTDSHNYLHYSSAHPLHVKRNPPI